MSTIPSPFYGGGQVKTPVDSFKVSGAPSTADLQHNLCTLACDPATGTIYGLAAKAGGTATWAILGGGAGAVATLTGGSGGALSPTGGNINILGTANQLTSTGSGSTITFSIPAAFTAPGSVTTTTTLAAGTTVTAGTGITSTTGNIVASAGNITATLGAVSAGSTVTAGTSITATAGDITATLGNVVINGAAKQLRVHGGAVTDFIGTATLVAGTVTVNNTNIAAADEVHVSRTGVNASSALGLFNVAISAGASFTITALKPADATTETGDASTVKYFIVRQV